MVLKMWFLEQQCSIISELLEMQIMSHPTLMNQTVWGRGLQTVFNQPSGDANARPPVCENYCYRFPAL